jgi:transposase
MGEITTIGVDLAKNVFQLHGSDAQGRVVLRKQLKRAQFLSFFVNLPPVLVAMESCSSAHHWARELSKLGHQVRLIAPQFVKPFVQGSKNDVSDAQAICEAATRPTMRFVAIKSIEQQSTLALHRARQGLIRARTAQINQIRALMGEFGWVSPQGPHQLLANLSAQLEQARETLPAVFIELIELLREQLLGLNDRIETITRLIVQAIGNDPVAQRLQTIPGIGPLSASALAASVGEVKSFKNGRSLAAWLGLVPGQHSSGGKAKLLGVSKRGDSYLRCLLVHGARSVLCSTMRASAKKPDAWIEQLKQRKHANVVSLAIANRNARIAWSVMAYGHSYEAERRQAA